jgi:EmrB/QacA subfamily drug resistance transporter
MRTRRRGPALALVCTAQFVIVLDVTIVAIALSSIQRDLRVSPATLQWVVTAYVLVFGGFLLVAGRAADLWGRRRCFMAGMGLFTAASLACGLAPSAAALVVSRAVQGLGAALVAPSALALLSQIFPSGPARQRAVGIWTAAVAGGGAAGWLLGGLISQGLGWPWVFLVNVPIGVAAVALAPLLLEESRQRSAARRLDLAGAVTVTAGLALLILGLTQAQETAPDAPGTLAALGGALVLLAGFAALERRVRDPLLPPGLLRQGALARASLVAAALTGATTPPMLLATLYVQQVQGRSPAEAGLEFPPFNLAVVAGSLLGPRVVAAVGTRAAMAAGLGGVVAGAGLFACVPAGDGYLVFLLPAFVLMGGGLGCASVASTAAGTAAAGSDRQGLASGLLNAAAQVGTAVGLAVLVTVAAARTDQLAAHGATSAAAQVGGFHWASLGAAVLAAAAALAPTVSLLGPRRATRSPAQAPEEAASCSSAGPADASPAPPAHAWPAPPACSGVSEPGGRSRGSGW